MWMKFGCLGLLGLLPLAWGCAGTEPALRPPKPQEEFVAPPQEGTYSNPVVYPKEYMEDDPLQKKAKSGLPGLMGRPGTGAPGQRPSFGMQ
jgi:hypothetical protein